MQFKEKIRSLKETLEDLHGARDYERQYSNYAAASNILALLEKYEYESVSNDCKALIRDLVDMLEKRVDGFSSYGYSVEASRKLSNLYGEIKAFKEELGKEYGEEQDK